MGNKHINLDLRKAKAEIKAIMDKYDCGGLVSLHNKTHTEFEMFFPKWSCCQIVKVGGDALACTFKHKSGEDDPELLRATLHLLMDSKQVCERVAKQIGTIETMIANTLEIQTSRFEDRQ
jgi:hypothetical protein